MKLIEAFKDFDIFSESIQFNSSRQRLRKRTIVGAFLTTSIIVLTGIYFVYQSYNYFSGEMEPKFRQQSFVSNKVQIAVNNEMFGFDFFSLYSEQSYLSEIQEKQNKTYIVFVPAFIFRNSTTSFRIPLDVIKCQSQELKGMNCIDVSKIPNQQLNLDNSNKLYSLITLYVYRCQDTDQYKKFVPDNCADENLINNFINKSPYFLNIKIQTSQYNTSSYQMQTQYRSQVFQNSLNIVSGYQFKMQSQKTKVNKGILLQSKQSYSSVISYQMITQTFDRQQIIKDKGSKYFSQIFIDEDENVTHISIQYPLFTEILALCNSTLALLLIFGTFCRKMAQNLIRRDIFFTLMKNFFSGAYLNVLQHNNLINFNKQPQNKYKIEENEIQLSQSEEEPETKPNIMPPHYIPKRSDRVFRLFIHQENGSEQQSDYIKEDCSNNLKQSNQSDCQSVNGKTDIEVSPKNKSICESPLSIDSQQTDKDQDFYTFKTNQNTQRWPLKQVDFEEAQNKETQKNQFKNYVNVQKLQLKQMLPLKESNNRLLKQVSLIPQSEVKDNKANHFNKMLSLQMKRKSIKSMIQQTDKRLESLNDAFLQVKLEDIIFQRKICNQENYLESKGIKKEVQCQIEQLIDDSLDFFSFYKDILFLKKAIMILLNQEQLSAIQIIGTDFNTKADKGPANHFKEQYNVLQSRELQIQYINQFLEKCQKRQKLETIDERILSSLIKYE